MRVNLLLALVLGACSPGKTPDTGDTGAVDTGDTGDIHETGDTSETGETGDSSDTSDSGDTNAAGPAFDATYALFTKSCLGCHSGTYAQGALDLSTRAVAYAQLVGQPAAGTMCADPAHTRVVPGDVEGSLLYAKLAGTQDCCMMMPEGEPPRAPPPFSAEQLAVVAEWIAGGALDRAP